MSDEKLIEFAVKALIIKDGKFLSMHKANIKSEKSELPGGRMIFGETVEETVIREVFEETGLRVKPIRLVDTWNYIMGNNQITGVIYLCSVDDDDEVRLSEEHDKYEWLYPDNQSIIKMNRLFRPQMENWDWENLILQNK